MLDQSMSGRIDRRLRLRLYLAITRILNQAFQNFRAGLGSYFDSKVAARSIDKSSAGPIKLPAEFRNHPLGDEDAASSRH